jgi:hypothetical protein
MKCGCGYEKACRVEDDGTVKQIGDEKFIVIEGEFKVMSSTGWDSHTIDLFACPKCGAIKMDR